MSRKKKTFICFIGIDGSGKSTLANRLLKWMNEAGVPTKLVWGAYELQIIRPLVNIGKVLFLHNKDAFTDYDEYYNSVKKTSRSRLLSTLYENLTLAEYFLQVFFKVRVPLTLGRSVITDRYVYDILIHHAVNLGYSEDKFKAKLKRFLRFCPIPNLIFLVDVPEEIAFQRKSDTPSIDYLVPRRKLYLSLRNDFETAYLDGSRALDELDQQIQQAVAPCLQTD